MKRKRQTSIVNYILHRQWESQQRGTLSMWTIYDHPRDFPDSFVSRRFEVAMEPVATGDIIIARELEPLRATMMEAGLVVMARNEGDDPKIIETWV